MARQVSAQRQLRFWGLGALVFIGLLWLLGDVLLPFVAGMAVAYLLDPLVDKLERLRAPRWLATTLVLLSFILVAVVTILLLFPLLRSQIVALVDMAPRWIAWAKDVLIPTIDARLHELAPEDIERIRTAVQEYAGTVAGWVANLFSRLLSGGFAIVDVLSVILITPIVAFYLLRDWDVLVSRLDGWLPRQHAPTIREQALEVDRTLAGFVRGQASVCVVLGLFYALALTVVGLDFGLVIGLFAGLLSFIPYVGSLVGFAASVGIAFFQWDELWRVGLVAGIFIVGQAVEGNFLTPKLVGERVGLHPVWVIFALMAAGSLFGFVGVLLAVPVAAVIGVVVRFLLKQYLASSLYTGPTPVPVVDPLDEGRPLHPAAEGAQGHAAADHPPVA